mmetsp:Transcript_2757/g.10895  ORF Transcript_2757/g.10895 Transcript_2757/m.10895 type:complete len:380 (-) Transcript_2757:25-1164(-)
MQCTHQPGTTRVRADLCSRPPESSMSRSPRVIGRGRQIDAKLLDHNRSSIRASLAALRQGQISAQGRHKATEVAIAGAGAVHELIVGNGLHIVEGHMPIHRDDRRQRTSRDDNSPLPRLHARDEREPRRHEGRVRGVPTLGPCPCEGLPLVAEEEVDVGQQLQQQGLPLSVPHHEGGRETHNQHAAQFLGACGHEADDRGCEEHRTVHHARPREQLARRWFEQMFHAVAPRGLQFSAHRALAVPRQHRAAARRQVGVHRKSAVHALRSDAIAQGIGEGVGADAAGKSRRSWLLQHPLSRSDRVEHHAAAHRPGPWQARKLCKQRPVALLGLNGGVKLQAIPREHLLFNLCENVEQWVAQRKHHRHARAMQGSNRLQGTA